MEVLVRNGLVVTASDVFKADIGIVNGRISQIGEHLEDPQAEIVDAAHCMVIPGGVDVHTHMESTNNGLHAADTFRTGTVAAAWGGTTTIIDFCEQRPGQQPLSALDHWHNLAAGQAVIDYGFHSIVIDGSQPNLDELRRVRERGVSTFKVFLAYRGSSMIDDLTFARVLDVARETDALVMVHAEHGDVVFHRQQMLLDLGHTTPTYHAVSRPPRVEAEATARAIALAELAETAIYIVHVSCEESLVEIERGRVRGVEVYAETCPQYLYTTDADLNRPNFEGGKFVFTPPPRSHKDQAVLWKALADGALQIVSSDHSPWNFVGAKDRGRDDFTKIPNGGHGVEERMALLYQGVIERRISLSRFVDLTAATPANVFGLTSQKGSIAVGKDADLVIWDPEQEHTLSVATHHSSIDYNMYEGLRVQGVARTVLLRGTSLIQDRNWVEGPARGAFLHRDSRRAVQPAE